MELNCLDENANVTASYIITFVHSDNFQLVDRFMFVFQFHESSNNLDK